MTDATSVQAGLATLGPNGWGVTEPNEGGKFGGVGVLTTTQAAALAAIAETAKSADSYSSDVWQDIAATGLAIPAPVFVKSVRLIGGTTPTLVLRDALVDTYTATSASTDVAFDSALTSIQLGYEYPLNKLFRMGVHATIGGTGSPVWSIKI